MKYRGRRPVYQEPPSKAGRRFYWISMWAMILAIFLHYIGVIPSPPKYVPNDKRGVVEASTADD